MGIKVDGIEAYGKREKRHAIPSPQQVQPQKQLSMLSAGTKKDHPSHIPSYLPDYPDPHAYIRTPTYKQPVTEYEAIREKAANQKRDIEKALTKFLAKTSETQSLFETEDNQFPLIAPKACHPSYMAALNPTDQVFDFEELEYYYQVANRKEDIPSKDGDDSDNSGDEKNEKDSEIKDEIHEETSKSKSIDANSSQSQDNIVSKNSNIKIDNPYLRAVSVPGKVKTEPF